MNWIFSIPFLLLVIFLTFIPLVLGFFLFPASLSGPELLRWFLDGSTLLATRVSFQYGWVSTLLSITMGMWIAYALFEMKRWVKPAFFFILLLWAIPLYVSLPTFRIGFAYIGFNPISSSIPAWMTITLSRIWCDLPLCVLVGIACLQKVSTAIRDSLILDGAGATMRMRAVYRHMLAPSFQALSILLLLNGLRDLTLPLMLTEGRPMMAEGFTPMGIAGATTTYGILLRNTMKSMAPDIWIHTSAIGVSLILLASFWVFWIHKRSWIWAIISLIAFEWLWRMGSGGEAIILLGLWVTGILLQIKPFRGDRLVWSGMGVVLASISFLSSSPVLYLLGFLLALRWLFSPWGSWGIKPLGTLSLVGIVLSALVTLSLLSATAFTDALYLPEWRDLSQPSFIHFQRLFQRGFDTNLLNSVWIAIGTGLLSLWIIPLVAAAAAQNKHIRTLVFFMISASLVLTGMNTLSPLYILFRNWGVLNSLIPLILTAGLRTLPLGFFILYEELRSIPTTLRESALIDGAGPWTLFRKILFPLILPGAIVVFIHGFINGWTSFISPLVFLTDPRVFPTSLRLYDFAGNLSLSYSQWGLFSAGSLLSASISIALLLPLRSKMMKGYLSEYS